MKTRHMSWASKVFLPLLLLAIALQSQGSLVEEAEPLHRLKRSINGGTENPKKDIRLPVNLSPSHYKLYIRPLPEEDAFFGEVVITVKCLSASNNITLHAVDLEIPAENVQVKDGETPVTVSGVEFQTGEQFLVVNLDGELEEGKDYQISIKFSGKISISRGWYRKDYVDNESGDMKVLLISNFRPTFARTVFPCFDEPQLKAEFEISIGRKDTVTALSNTPLASSQALPDHEGWMLDSFQKTPPMSTYMAGIALTEFEKRERLAGVTNVALWTPKGALDTKEYLSEYVVDLVKYYENYFDTPHPLGKVDVLFLPESRYWTSDWTFDCWGMPSMKNIEYKSSKDLHIAKFLESFEKLYLAKVLAGQWLGGLVTSDWWDDVKLQDGLALLHAVEAQYAAVPSMHKEMTDMYALFFAYGDEDVSDISREPKWIARHERVTLSMYNETLSPVNHQKTLRRLIKEKKFSTYTKEYFWQIYDDICHEEGTLPQEISLADMAATWSDYARFPIVTINRNYDNNTATLSQKVYIEFEYKVEDENILWTIPVPFATQDQLQFDDRRAKVFLREKEQEIQTGLPDSNNFILANPEYVGFYYVNYDTDNWDLITRYLNSDNFKNIPALTRAQLIHNTAYLGKSRDLSFAYHLRLQLFLRRDLDTDEPWFMAFVMAFHLGMSIDGTDAWEHYKNYLIYLSNPAYQKLGEDDQEGDSPSRKEARRNVRRLRSSFGASEQVSKYRQEVKKWMDLENPDNEVPMHLRDLCNVAEFGSREEWDFLFERYLNLPTSFGPKDRNYFIGVIAACARDTYKVQKVLDHILEGKEGITKQQANMVFNKLTSNSYGWNNLLDHLAEHYDQWKDLYADDPAIWRTRVSKCLEEIRTQEYLDKANKLYEDHKGNFGVAEDLVETKLKKLRVQVPRTQVIASEIKEVLVEINQKFEDEDL